MNGIYMGARLDDESVDKLVDWCERYDVPNAIAKDELHTTIVYSREYEKVLAHSLCHHKAKIAAIEEWTTQEGVPIVVLKLDSSDLQVRHKFMHEFYSTLTYDYEDYNPHVTLSYDIGIGFSVSKKANQELIGLELTFDKEYLEVIKPRDTA